MNRLTFVQPDVRASKGAPLRDLVDGVVSPGQHRRVDEPQIRTRTERDAGGGTGGWREVLLDERSSEPSPWVPTARGPGSVLAPRQPVAKAWYFRRKRAISRTETADDPAVPGPYDAIHKNNSGR